MSTYVIADIHGCFETFTKLLDQVKFNESSDCLYILGDIVDRGAGFYDLYQWVRERYKKSVFLTMGNHEFGFMEDVSCLFTHTYQTT